MKIVLHRYCFLQTVLCTEMFGLTLNYSNNFSEVQQDKEDLKKALLSNVLILAMCQLKIFDLPASYAVHAAYNNLKQR